MSKKETPINFEKNLRELEQLVEKMEQGDLSLEESVKCFERGIALSRACQQALTEAEQKVQLLQKNTADEPGDGELTDFPDTEQEPD